MTDEPHGYFTYFRPRNREPAILYAAGEVRALAQGMPLRQGQPRPSCGGRHTFTKGDLRPVDRRRTVLVPPVLIHA
jgi:hypothetical protein